MEGSVTGCRRIFLGKAHPADTQSGEGQAIQFFPLIVLPTFLLAGIFWPVEAIPSWLRPLSYVIPPSYAVDAIRSVMLRGWGIGEIWVDLVAFLAFAVFFLSLAIWSLKRSRA